MRILAVSLAMCAAVVGLYVATCTPRHLALETERAAEGYHAIYGRPAGCDSTGTCAVWWLVRSDRQTGVLVQTGCTPGQWVNQVTIVPAGGSVPIACSQWCSDAPLRSAGASIRLVPEPATAYQADGTEHPLEWWPNCEPYAAPAGVKRRKHRES